MGTSGAMVDLATLRLVARLGLECGGVGSPGGGIAWSRSVELEGDVSMDPQMDPQEKTNSGSSH